MLKHWIKYSYKRLLLVLSVVLFLSSCNRYESRYVFLWEQTFERGAAKDVGIMADSSIVACGTSGDTAVLIKLSKDHIVEIDYRSPRSGVFTSMWSDTSYFMLAGSSNGLLLLSRLDKTGTMVWDTTIATGFSVDMATIKNVGTNTFKVVASASADSVRDEVSGLFFADIDSSGNVTGTKEIMETTSIYSGGMDMDENGNIFLAITRRYGNEKPTAGAVKFNKDLHKIWEAELYNNPNFGAATQNVLLHDGVLYLAGRTATILDGSIILNSFMVSLSPNDGTEIWRRYCERLNTGVGVVVHPSGSVMMLNSNCFVVTLTDRLEGSDMGKIRMFDGCDSYATTERGSAISLCDGENLLIGGSRGGAFFLAVKATDIVDEF